MTKTNYLIRKLEGQIEKWEEEINNHRCKIDETSSEELKDKCQEKISELQIKIAKAEDDILELKDMPMGMDYSEQ